MAICLSIFVSVRFSFFSQPSPLRTDPFTKAIVALLLFMATNNLGTDHSELFMHGQYVTVASFVVIASYAKRTPAGFWVRVGVGVGGLKWNQMICRATDLCLIYRAGCRPDRHANKFQMRWRHKLDSAHRRNYKRGPTKLWHSKIKKK